MPWGSGPGGGHCHSLGCVRRFSAGAGAVVQPRMMVQTFLIFLMSLSSSLGVTVWVDWMRSLSLSRDAICDRNTGQLHRGEPAAGTAWWGCPAASSLGAGHCRSGPSLRGPSVTQTSVSAHWVGSCPPGSQAAGLWLSGTLDKAAPLSGLQAPLYIRGSPPSSPTIAPLFVGFYCGKMYIT